MTSGQKAIGQGTGGQGTGGQETGGQETGGHEAIGEGFEPRDANTRAIAIAMVVGVATIVLSVGIVFVLLGTARRDERRGPPPTREQAMVLTPPGAKLQSDPLREIAVLRQKEEATLTGYRWIDDGHTLAEVPIARAMTMVVGRPLDPAAGDASAPAGPLPGTTP